MRKLNDYSGQFLPELKLSHFSSDTLVELLGLYTKLFIVLDAFWYLTVKEMVGNEKALACDIRTLKRLWQYEIPKITQTLNIQGNDVIALMKAIQISHRLQHTRYKIETKNHNSATLTVTYCPTLEGLEKEGAGREQQICNIVEPEVFSDLASFFNPDIKVKCLKSPPRKSQDEICCRWQFTCDK